MDSNALQLETIADRWQGTFHNRRQVVATLARGGPAAPELTREARWMTVERLDAPQLGALVLYFQEFRASAPQLAHRQRVVLLRVDPQRGQVRAEQLFFRGGPTYDRPPLEAARVAALGPEDFRAPSGLRSVLRGRAGAGSLPRPHGSRGLSLPPPPGRRGLRRVRDAPPPRPALVPGPQRAAGGRDGAGRDRRFQLVALRPGRRRGGTLDGGGRRPAGAGAAAGAVAGAPSAATTPRGVLLETFPCTITLRVYPGGRRLALPPEQPVRPRGGAAAAHRGPWRDPFRPGVVRQRPLSGLGEWICPARRPPPAA